MAYRVGAGEAFRSIDYTTDARGFLLRPPSRGHQRYVVHDDYSEYDSDETSPHPRPLAWHVYGQQQDRERESRREGTPERDWSPEPEHQFFVIREGTPPSPGLAPFPAPAPPAVAGAARDVHLQPHHHFHPQQHRHQQHHRPLDHANSNISPPPVACSMERTPSGRTILTETAVNQLDLECADFSPEEDRLAALQVKRHMAKPRQNVKRHERILRALIHPKPHAAKGTEFPLDNDALESIFSAADEIFFQGRLSRRVHWEWSSFESSSVATTTANHGAAEDGGTGGGLARMSSSSIGSIGSSSSTTSSSGCGGGIIGTTALRRASPPSRGGYETLIVLSSPILMDTGYNRRLLISTFLHELIHSYLFICCGFKARHCGGHTEGFKAIAAIIDGWAGRGTLRLCDMEADLEHFREREQKPVVGVLEGGEYGGDRGRQVLNYHQHDRQQQQQQQAHYHQHQPQNYQQQQRQQQQPPQQKRYHHHGGVDFYDLNESPWSTGPRVVFGSSSRSSSRHHQHHHHHQQQTTLDSSPATTTGGPGFLLSPSSSPPPPPTTASGYWNYPPPRTRTPLSSPTPPPSMSTTPLSSATTLIGSDTMSSFHGREEVMYEYDHEYEGPDGPGTGGVVGGQPQQQQSSMMVMTMQHNPPPHHHQHEHCHIFTGPEMKYF